jgi:OPT family oligopeptide transporter
MVKVDVSPQLSAEGNCKEPLRDAREVNDNDIVHSAKVTMDADNIEMNDLFSEKMVNASQLTFKALSAGVLAGAFGSFLAIYNGLKTGIVPSLNIISALMGFFLCKAILKMIPNGIFTPQENVVIQTTAVACIQVAQSSGFANGLLAMGKNAAEGVQGPGQNPNDYINLTYSTTFAFCLSVGFFGLFIAFPLRKYAIIDRKLQFPSGTATATVIETMHGNANEAWQSLKRLITWAVVSTLQSVTIFFLNGGKATALALWPGAGKYGIAFDWDLSSCAIGMILPNCINGSILLGGVIAMAIINPWIQAHHQCNEGDAISPACWFYLPEEQTYASSYLAARAYYFYPGVAMVVVDGFYSIIKLVFLLIKGMRKTAVAEQEADNESDPREAARLRRMNDIFLGCKLPTWMMITGYLGCCTLCIILVGTIFKVALYQVLIAVALTPIFSVGIIVGVGMTDWDVSSSFGKLMLFPFGMMNSGAHASLIPPLAACMITISGCGAAAGMMQNFKTGYLLGASPLAMVVAQLVGAAAGVVIAPGMFEIFNHAYHIPGDPSTEAVPGIFGSAYRVLAGVFASGGISALPKHTGEFCLAFAVLALVLNVLSDVVPSKVGPYMPNAMAMSIGLMMGPGVGIDFLLGGLAISLWRFLNPDSCRKFSVVVASGCLAGGGIGQVIQIVLTSAGVQPFPWPKA